MENQTNSNSSKLWIIIVVAIVAVAAVAITLIITGRSSGDTPQNVSAAIGEDGRPILGYAEGTVALDEDSLQSAVDAAFDKTEEGYFTTAFKMAAYSADGQTFSCYIGNSELNTYDMYIQIFADDQFTDQLFLSGLLRPGTVFEEITLDHPLDVGTHTVYVFFTQMEDDMATIHGQVSVTMDFTVTG